MNTKKMPKDNLNMCVKTVIKSAQKRRSYAIMAVKTLNMELGFRPELKMVK